MKTIKYYLAGVVISAILATGFIYLSLGIITEIIFFCVPLLILAGITEEQKCSNGALVGAFLAVALVYSVMYSNISWTSLGLVAVLIICGFIWKPVKKLSYMAAWLTGLELACLIMEYIATHQYFMDNIWHDIATVIFAIYAVAWDIYYEKREVTP